jgi:hypothetical protein
MAFGTGTCSVFSACLRSGESTAKKLDKVDVSRESRGASEWCDVTSTWGGAMDEITNLLSVLVVLLVVLSALLGNRAQAVRKQLLALRTGVLNVPEADKREHQAATSLEDALLDVLSQQQMTSYTLNALATWENKALPLDKVVAMVRAASDHPNIPPQVVQRVLRILTYGPFVKLSYGGQDSASEAYQITTLGKQCHAALQKRGFGAANARASRPAAKPTTSDHIDDEAFEDAATA